MSGMREVSDLTGVKLQLRLYHRIWKGFRRRLKAERLRISEVRDGQGSPAIQQLHVHYIVRREALARAVSNRVSKDMKLLAKLGHSIEPEAKPLVVLPPQVELEEKESKGLFRPEDEKTMSAMIAGTKGVALFHKAVVAETKCLVELEVLVTNMVVGAPPSIAGPVIDVRDDHAASVQRLRDAAKQLVPKYNQLKAGCTLITSLGLRGGCATDTVGPPCQEGLDHPDFVDTVIRQTQFDEAKTDEDYLRVFEEFVDWSEYLGCHKFAQRIALRLSTAPAYYRLALVTLPSVTPRVRRGILRYAQAYNARYVHRKPLSRCLESWITRLNNDGDLNDLDLLLCWRYAQRIQRLETGQCNIDLRGWGPPLGW